MLLTLCAAESVRAVLAADGIDVAALRREVADLHESVEPEPADWRVRIGQRGAGRGSDPDLDVLLALVRSADCHAYQLLERAGAACGSLRKRLIEQLRANEAAALTGAQRPARASTRTEAVPEDSEAAARPRTVEVQRMSTSTGPIRQVPGRGRPEAPRPAAVRAPEPQPGRTRRLSVETGETRTPRSAEQAPRVVSRPAEQAPRTAPQVATTRAAPQVATEPTPAAPRPEPDRGARLAAIDPSSLPPLHGRDGELARLADAVLRRSPRPPLLVGPSGSGRTLLARHLAGMLHQPVYYLSATRYEDEDGLRADLAAVARHGGVAILDDLDRIGGDGPPALLGALAKAWSSGQPPIVAIASPEGQARLAAWAPGLTAALDVVGIQPLEGEDLRAAVAAAAPAVLAHHGLSLGPGARLAELVRLADRFLGGLAQPGRSLDLLDLACARTLREGRASVGRETWQEIVCERSGVPRERIEGLGHQEMLDLEAELARKVVGHEHALKAIAQLIRRNRAGFGSQRPTATVLLLGPSGVGKTEIAKALCGALFDRADAFVRLDMSEYAEAHAVARIVGAPPGYVGHEHGGALTDPLLKQPHCVVLLDEIEKAHRDVHQLLLQVFDEGRLTDGRGRTIDFRHAAILMTSNLGATCLDATGDARLDEARVLEAARAAFPVELWNRIEAPLVLQPLAPDQLGRICARLVKTSSDRLLRERGIRYRLTDAATRHVVGLCGGDLALGARPLRHVLTRSVEGILADAILRGQVRAGMHVDVDVERGELVLLTSRA